MQANAGVFSFPLLGAAPQLDLPPPHRAPWSLSAGAAAAALLLHALVLLFLLWPFLSSMLWPEKPPPTEVAIPITIVPELPKPPPPPPQPQPQPAQQEPRPRQSGPEEEGGLAESGKGKPEERTAPEAASPAEATPPPPEAASPAETTPAPPQETPAPPPPREAVSPPPEPAPPSEPATTKPAEAAPTTDQSATVHLPLPAKPPATPKRKSERKTAQVPMAVGRTAGDRYLNSIRDRIERVRSYPPLARGRQLRGLAVYAVAIDRAGRLLDIRLMQSSGYDMLDREGERMIRAAAPLPAVPPDVAAGRAEVEFGIDIMLYPN